ncbi:hypothetical protein LIA77_01424 [Sarocladium implicatum]|nr:hypothetical protein LIA77_01424 [Sarocladium implicatum]
MYAILVYCDTKESTATIADMSLTDRGNIYVSFRVLLYEYFTYRWLPGCANTLGAIFVHNGCEEQTQTISSTPDEYRQMRQCFSAGARLLPVRGSRHGAKERTGTRVCDEQRCMPCPCFVAMSRDILIHIQRPRVSIVRQRRVAQCADGLQRCGLINLRM